VNRGGSWNNNAENCRTANRNNNDPGNRNNNLGFRLAAPAHRDGGCLTLNRTLSRPLTRANSEPHPQGRELHESACGSPAENFQKGLKCRKTGS